MTQPAHKWGPPYDRGAILGRVRAVETGGTTGYERKLEAELRAAREALEEAGLPETASVQDLIRHHRNNAALAAGFDKIAAQEREKGLREALADFYGFTERARPLLGIGYGQSLGGQADRLLVDHRALAVQRTEEAGGRITHGRHCTCSACAAQDWGEPGLAPCGMHGPSCPAEYQPWGAAGTYRRTEKADG